MTANLCVTDVHALLEDNYPFMYLIWKGDFFFTLSSKLCTFV